MGTGRVGGIVLASCHGLMYGYNAVRAIEGSFNSNPPFVWSLVSVLDV